MMRRLLLAAAGCLALPGALGLAGGATPTPVAAAGTGPCATMATSATSYHHVIWVWMENHSFSTIIGSPQAPYINRLAGECGLATNYHNVTHPSLPNYVAATSGLALPALAPFLSDCDPTRACSTGAPSLFGQGETWRAYEDSMPANCTRSDAGPYAVRHDPPPYYTSLQRCARYDVPYSTLASNLADSRLPAFSFITPNVLHDMHSGTVAQGDTWLSQNLPTIFASSLYRAGKVAVFVTWDEGDGGGGNDCARNTTGPGCHVATIVISPSTRVGITSSELFNHYSLLRTAEQLLRLPYLGQAARARSMTAPFGL